MGRNNKQLKGNNKKKDKLIKCLLHLPEYSGDIIHKALLRQ